MKFHEVEFKYRADGISLAKFQEFCEAKEPEKYIIASGFDHFYDNETDAVGFYRHRVGPDMNQLTYKRKTSATNNFVRKEHNLDFSKKVSVEQAAAYVKDFGYTLNTTIFKNCFVYKYEYYTLVFYICYDIGMKELGRFMEIEMDEEYAWKSEEEAMVSLVAMERLSKTLGISAQSRVKKSLYELFRQEK